MIGYDYPSLRVHFVEGVRKGDPRWNDNLSPDELQTLWNVKLEDERVMDIKIAAREVILARVPEWKQLNMTARFAELVDKGDLTSAEEAEKAAMKSVWAWVKQVRAESDRLEQAGLTKNDATWPGY